MQAGVPILTISGPIARVSLRRPAVKNRLQPEDLTALAEIFTDLAKQPDLRAVVIAAEGNVFSAGFDLNALAAGHVGTALEGPGGFGAMVNALQNLPAITIARLQGGVYGGATDLALACDFRVGVTGMVAQMPAALIGLHYYKSGILRFASRLGINNAKRMFLLAEPIHDHELLKIGFLTDLVAPDRLDETIERLTSRLAANAPMALQGVKQALNELAAGSWSDENFIARADAALASLDLREGLSAAMQKRSPQFKNV